MKFAMHDRVIIVGGTKGYVCHIGKGEFSGHYSIRVDGTKDIVTAVASNMHPLTPWPSRSKEDA